MRITDYNLSASNLVRIFRLIFKSEIGRKSLTVSGLQILGTRVMNELLMHSRFMNKS